MNLLLELKQLSSNGIKKIGTWKRDSGFTSENTNAKTPQTESNATSLLIVKTLIVINFKKIHLSVSIQK